uniref:Neprilysin n=1 Tax=Rhabditophanes sp. KR3021 TaxID=114890 RepID=A0AC35U6Q2_9BILA
MNTNESQIQLISIQDGAASGSNSRSSSPFNADPTMRVSPRVSYKSSGAFIKKFIWWYKRTKLERILILAILVMSLVLFFTLYMLIVSSGNSSNHQLTDLNGKSNITTTTPLSITNSTAKTSTTQISLDDIANLETKDGTIKICVTAGCIQAANALLMSMNKSVDPCENFFEYACGRWNKEHSIPDGMSQYGTFNFVREQVRSQLKIILESPDHNESKSVNMVKTVYTSCMNTTELVNENTKTLRTELTKLGGWPLLRDGTWSEDNFDLTTLLSAARNEFGVEVFFQVYVYADSKDTTKNILNLDQSSLSLGRGSRDYYLNETMFASHLAAYKHYLIDFVNLLKTDWNLALQLSDIEISQKELLEFETEFARIIVPEDHRRNNTRMHNKQTIHDLDGFFDGINWLTFFKTIIPAEVNYDVSSETNIIVTEIEYLRKMNEFFKKTEKRIIVNYVMWRIVQTYSKVLDERFETVKQELSKTMSGQETKPPRWKGCIATALGYLPLAIGSVYVRDHFHPSDKEEAMVMISNLQESFIQLVKKNDWVSEKTKTVAIDKANAMIKSIGYPDFILDTVKLDAYYADLNITEGNTFVQVFKQATKWGIKKDFLKLKEPFDKHEFDVSPAAVNAFYSPEKNGITFPAGILQPPFFSSKFIKAVNYGAIGAVIGHEITHGFDDQGSQYDKSGNLNNWWDSESYENFKKKKECIIDQYNKYKVPGTNHSVNGKLTQGENIADNGGLKETYLAYKLSTKKDENTEARLPGLHDLDNDKIFFLSYAHFWCGHKKNAAAVQQVLTDEHSPEIFRVIGVLSNMQEFADTFNCPLNSALNPPNKCSVW